MNADIDFRPFICEAIRLNGWDDPEHPIIPNMIKGDKDCTLNSLHIGGNSLQYEITPDDFMLINGFHVLFYSVDDNNKLFLIPSPSAPSKNQYQTIPSVSNVQSEMFISVAKLLEKKDPISWLISEWIPQGKGLIQMYGASGTGKSFLALDWMLSLITGQTEWQGFDCCSARCVYLCGEGQRGIAKRINAWLQHHGMSYKSDKQILEKNGLVLNSSALLSLDVKDQLDIMQSTLDQMGFTPDLICVDTLGRFMRGNENDTRDATAFVHACDALAGKYNCVVLLVHHIGWSSDAQNRARGSSVIHSSVDMDFLLKECNGVLVLSQEKNKDFEKSQPVYLALQSVQLIGNNEKESSAVLVKADKPEDESIKDITRQNDEVLCLDAFKAFGVNRNGLVSITVEDFKKHCQGKLADRKGKPYEGTSFTNQFNPNQGKYISRLLSYRVVEYMGENKHRLQLIDPDMLSLFHLYRSQQQSLDA